MSSKVLPEAVWRAFRDEVSTAFVFEVEDKLIEFVKAWYAGMMAVGVNDRITAVVLLLQSGQASR